MHCSGYFSKLMLIDLPQQKSSILLDRLAVLAAMDYPQTNNCAV